MNTIIWIRIRLKLQSTIGKNGMSKERGTEIAKSKEENIANDWICYFVLNRCAIANVQPKCNRMQCVCVFWCYSQVSISTAKCSRLELHIRNHTHMQSTSMAIMYIQMETQFDDDIYNDRIAILQVKIHMEFSVWSHRIQWTRVYFIVVALSWAFLLSFVSAYQMSIIFIFNW